MEASSHHGTENRPSSGTEVTASSSRALRDPRRTPRVNSLRSGSADIAYAGEVLCRAVVMIVCASAAARAESSVSVTLNQAGRDLADQIGANVGQIVTDAEMRINELFELQGLPPLLRSFANTAVFANHSLGVDYQPDPNDLMLGVVADSAIAADARLSSDKVFSATVINYGIIASVGLGRWKHPRWTLSANGSYASTTIRTLAGELLSGGVHVQYNVIPTVVRGHFRWSGLSVTTGLDIAHWKIGIADELSLNFPVVGTNDRANVELVSKGTLEVVSQTVAVPVELTTGIRLGNVFGIYTGGGLTFAGGSSTVTAMLDSVLVINADDTPIGTALITASETDGPNAVTVHGLFGIALHTSHVRVFVQGLIAPDERAVSLGLRAGLD